MSSKSKFKLFFKTKAASGNTGGTTLRPEIEWELRPEQPASQRCKTLKDLGDLQLHNLNLKETSITKLWDLTKDLIVPNKPAEYRQTALTFYMKLIHSQYKNLDLMREHFFLVIQNHEVSEDLRHRLELLDTLTENGKNIKNFEEKIGKFMLHWIPAISEAHLLRPYLEMLVNLIKFNAAHLDNDIVVGIVHNACQLSCTVDNDDIGLQCLTILEMVMGYTIFPSDPLPQCVVTLCRTVNYGPYCTSSWRIMKNLLGTQLGYHSMKMMCNILNDRSLYEDAQLLRGAVFHLNMNIFGSNVVFQVSPMFYASTVLTSFLHALDSRQVIVTFEVILSTRKVINKYKSELPEIIWDRICDIMAAIVDNIEYYERINIDMERLEDLQNNFHENIDCIERLLKDEQRRTQILANLDRIYDLIERVAESRPEASVLQLIEYRSSKVTATRPEWLHVLNDFVRRFYKIPNPAIRIKTIQSLVQIMDLNRSGYEEEILERVVIPHFTPIAQEPDVTIRIAVAKALVEFARHCDTKRCGELLDILEKIINRPFVVEHGHGGSAATDAVSELSSSKTDNSGASGDILDIIIAIDGLVEIFVIKLYRLPSCHAIKTFNILVGHLEMHYERPRIFEQANIVRHKIFTWMLKARANASYHIGYPDPTASSEGAIKFSYYLGIDSSLPLYGMAHQHQRQQVISQLAAHEIIPSAHFTTISIRRACKIIVKCLESDRDFKIFQLVIRELPKVLQNKALIQGNDIESLALALFKICSESNKSLHLSYKPTTDEFHALVLPAIASLVIYHQFIQPSHQFNIISALTLGIFSGIANVCINTMTTMILEMPEKLMRTLPDILLQMSKMSDTTAVAIPVLEFLSILSRLSNHLFTNFIPRQYMYVFAISLPYTKPHRYDHYTVSLAHHVIAGWFLKCKLELRKNFVTYIISSIQSNASMLYDDINKLTRNIQRQDFNSLNEDSSNRKRSTSLTERGSRNTNARGDSEMRPLMNDSLKSFHAELAETCIDFLARHTFSPCSALPKRLPAVEYLLKDGLSQTWLVGHNLVTITTSGCPSAPTRNGLCDRCAQLGKAPNLLSTSAAKSSSGETPLSPEIVSSGGGVGSGTQQTVGERRYTKVSLQHSSGNESAGSIDLTSSSSSNSAATNTTTTQRQTSNSSTASLEALSRRGSNPDATDVIGGAGSSSSLHGGGGGVHAHSTTTTTTTSMSIGSPAPSQAICIRSCTGWAEVLVRRPTGNISWIVCIQNPISADCFGQDLPFSNMVALFLPTAHGGVFGPDFVQPPQDVEPEIDEEEADEEEEEQQQQQQQNVGVVTATAATATVVEKDSRKTIVSKVRALQRQEELSTAAAAANEPDAVDVSASAAIDIPKTSAGKRGKEALSGSASDGEADGDSAAFIDGVSKRSRNPVRRVNSSPEMSSSWRHAFLASKPVPLSQRQEVSAPLSRKEEPGFARLSADLLSPQQQQQQQQQKKKSVQYNTKDMRVSCEAIPEEIAGSTPPQTEKSASTKTLETAALPPKQHSADDVTNGGVTGIGLIGIAPVQQSSSASSLKAAGVSKPPAPPLSPRLHDNRAALQHQKNLTPQQGLAKSNSGGSSAATAVGTDYNNGGNGGATDMMRGRSKTISVVREVNNGKAAPVLRTSASQFRSFGGGSSSASSGGSKAPLNAKLCMNPSFVFMQLYHTGQLQVTDTPLKVPADHANVLKMLDLAPPFETHKIGVLYVGQSQCNNYTEILRNSYGSTRYVEFLRCIGTLVNLKDAAQNNLFVPLDTQGTDGKFTYMWKDDIVQVTFHVATLMPTNLKRDPSCNEKRKHIGNDYVNIVYNESGEEYNLSTISGQFNYACVIVEPLELNTNRIYVKARPELAKFVCHPEPKIVSDRSAPLLARQMALHANLASHVYQSLQKKNPYASNWLERLRIIKRLRTKLIESQNSSQHQNSGASSVDISSSDDHSADPSKKQNTNRDFTKYT